MRRLLAILALLLAVPLSAQTRRNNDSCDISVTPAATLLLPYFEVDVTAPAELAQTTLVSFVNTSQSPQIARMTLWSDWSYPLLTLDLFLTGYDALSLNLHDLLTTGSLAHVAGMTTPPGALSLPNYDDPRHRRAALANCLAPPPAVPRAVLSDITAALTTGAWAQCGASRIGGTHTNAIGFATIDVVANCAGTSPTDPRYFDDLLFDNVLIGDYVHVAPNRVSGNFAGGTPLVHLRAVPEGGLAGQRVATNLPYTFYDRLAPAGRAGFDRRQPLPSTFAARYIQGGGMGFLTNFTIWRETTIAPDAACSSYIASSLAPALENVRFDERENPTTTTPQVIIGWIPTPPRFPSSSRVSSTHSVFPPLSSGDVAGWMYLNLHNGHAAPRPAATELDRRPPLLRRPLFRPPGGCPPRQRLHPCHYRSDGSHPASDRTEMKRAIASLALLLALPLSAQMTANDDSCDLSTAPAATLLLPYFEVDLDLPNEISRTTLVTVVNTSQQPQIARMTLWTDWSYPVLTQDLFLTGYDSLSLNLRELLTTGSFSQVAGTTTPPGALSLPSSGNPRHRAAEMANCRLTPPPIPAAILTGLRATLTNGQLADICGTSRVGGSHVAAIGFVTFDLVASCSGTGPRNPAYFDDLLYDNVLIGDYQYVAPHQRQGNFASGAPLVHIRAMPEGGAAGERIGTNLPYTFYGSLMPPVDAKRDRRQPLPSTFAARYIQGGGSSFATNIVIWRETVNGAEAALCSAYVNNSRVQIADVVRFDERENPTSFTPQVIVLFTPNYITRPSASSVNTSSSSYPPLSSGDVGGWMYLNLNPPYTPIDRPLQNWVSVHRFAEGRYSTMHDAVPLANGCTPAQLFSNRTNPIGPR